MVKLDKKDIRLLSILDWNARMPITQIAKQVQLNKDVVRYRMKNLEEQGVIKRYYSLIDINKLGYMTFRGYFSFINFNSSVKDELISYLDNNFNAGIIFSRDGEYDLGIISWEKSVYGFQQKLAKLKQEFGDYFENVEFTIFTEFNHYSLTDFNENFSKEISLSDSNQISLKSDDKKILEIISSNSRISSVELSERLGISQTTILYKIRVMENKEIIKAYRTEIDYSKLGYENYFLEIYLHKQKDLSKIKEYAKNNKNTIYSVLGIFGADIELECEFKNRQELHEFINEIKDNFSSIKKVKYCSTLNYFKMKYFPDKNSK